MSPKGLVHNVFMKFFTLKSTEMEVSKVYFFDVVAIHNNHASYVKHVLGSIYIFLPCLVIWVWRGVKWVCIVRKWILYKMELSKTIIFFVNQWTKPAIEDPKSAGSRFMIDLQVAANLVYNRVVW